MAVASGYPPDQVKVSCSGCSSFSKGKKGEYIAKVGGAGKKATVFVKADGKTIGKQEFRVFPLPPAQPFFAGKTLGTFSNRKGTNNYGVPFADLSIFQKIKMDMSRNKELKQYAAELQKQKELKEQIERDAQIQRAINRQPPKDPGDRGRDDTPGFGKTTQGNYTNQFQGGDPGLMADGGLMGRGGSRRKSYFDGGIVSLRRR